MKMQLQKVLGQHQGTLCLATYLKVAVLCLKPHTPEVYQWPKPAWYDIGAERFG